MLLVVRLAVPARVAGLDPVSLPFFVHGGHPAVVPSPKVVRFAAEDRVDLRVGWQAAAKLLCYVLAPRMRSFVEVLLEEMLAHLVGDDEADGEATDSLALALGRERSRKFLEITLALATARNSTEKRLVDDLLDLCLELLEPGRDECGILLGTRENELGGVFGKDGELAIVEPSRMV